MQFSSSRLAFGSIIALALLSGCSGGGSSSSAPAIVSQAPPPPQLAGTPAVATSYEEQAVMRGLSFGFGFSTGMNEMVRLFAGGAASGDVDGDGDIDLFIVRGDLGPNLLYINEGGMSFREAASTAGLAYTKDATTNYRHSGPTFGDLDGDGDLDLFIGGLENDPSLIFLNDGAGIFTDATAGSGFDQMDSIHTISAALGDYDRDGDLDMAMAHWGTPRNSTLPGETETLWRNDSDASGVKFTAVSAPAGISAELDLNSMQGVLGTDHDYTFAPSFADINGDGYPDLLSVADFGGSRIFINQQDGTFERATYTPDDSNGMGAAVGDYDNDGDLDWFVSSINGNRLFENLGGGSFRRNSESGVEPGGWGWGSCFADFNADGRLDIYQTNGWEIGKTSDASNYVDDTSRLWMQNSDGTFSDLAEVSNMLDTEQGRGIVCDDFNGDGDVDILLLTADPVQAALYWDNQLQDDNFLTIRVEGLTPNTGAIGAQVEVTAGGETQTRVIGINSNFTSHNSTEQIIGLGDQTAAATVRVIWPDGTSQSQDNVAAGQVLTLEQPAP